MYTKRRSIRLQSLAIAACIMIVSWRSTAALLVHPAEQFFTTVAERLLQQQLGMRLTEVQVAPINQWDTAIHRIFQVTANIYDATSTNEFPSVFRPVFVTNAAGVYLAGFTNDNRASTLEAWLEANPYGVPLVIAARKGFPSFNEFTLRTDVLTQRNLQVTRPSTAPGTQPSGTNQMYTLSLSNFFGVEAWNPYAAYPRAVQITVSNVGYATLTNHAGTQASAPFILTAQTNLVAGSWRRGAFQLPMLGTAVSLTNAAYRFAENSFAPSQTYETFPGFPIPSSTVTVSNRLTYLATDGENIIDFVCFNFESAVDLQGSVWGANPYESFGASGAMQDVWNTNRSSINAPPDGILQQLSIALGNPPTTLLEWRTLGLAPFVNNSAKEQPSTHFDTSAGFQPPREVFFQRTTRSSWSLRSIPRHGFFR